MALSAATQQAQLHELALEALRAVEDPELGYSIVELGLVRGLELGAGGRRVHVWLTLTSPMCPMGPEIISATEAALQALPGVEAVEVELVWSPPWDPERDASDEVKAQLDIWY